MNNEHTTQKIISKLLNSKSITNKIKKDVELTRIYENEYGFTICKNKNLTVGNSCTGNYCSINIEYKCPKGKIIYGDHHTHPSSSSNLSYNDMASHFAGMRSKTYQTDFPIKCVSSPNDIYTTCIIPKQKLDTNKMYLVIKNIIQNRSKSIIDREVEIEKYLNEHYNTFKFKIT